MSSIGYGFLWNLPSYGNLSISPENTTWFSEASQNVDFWITTPPAATSASPYATLLRQFVDVVGHAPPMPFYSTGFIQSKNRYRTQAQLLEVGLIVIQLIQLFQVAEGYIARKLPISVIVVDFFHWVHQVTTFNHFLSENKSREIGVLIFGVGQIRRRWLEG